jgi:hypothetical protein
MKLEFLMEYTATLRQPPDRLGAGPLGARTIFTVTGGSFAGPRLRGKLLPGGGDWYLRDAHDIGRLDVRATLETEDGALIYLQYQGINRPEPGKAARAPGEPSRYGDRYFMTAPRFETADERYQWLNGLVCVAEGNAAPDGVEYRVYAVLND